MNIIPVVFSTDKNYIFPTAVVMASMLKTAKEQTFYEFYIQTTKGCIPDCERIFNCLKGEYENYTINYLVMNPAEFKKVSVNNEFGHVTMPTFYRLMLANQLVKYDRCIVLDSDILVREDLSEMFNVNLGNNYIAGVKSWIDRQNSAANLGHMKILGLPSMDNFIYLGVLVVNLKKIRDDNLTEQFVFHMSKGYPRDDQDVFNVCCYGKITFLPLKYNLMFRYYKIGFPKGNIVYSEEELLDGINNPIIIHYPGKINKPWFNEYVPLSSEWWNVAKIFCPTKEFNYFDKEKCTYPEYLGFKNFENLCLGKSVVICGYTDIGKLVVAYWKRNFNISVAYIMDNDTNKSGLKYLGIETKTFNELKSCCKVNEYLYIITNQKAASAINQQLIENDIDEKNIIVYKLPH